MGQPLFSIIIPTYNSSKTVLECLKSVVGQSFTNFEVLIIDGLSDDNTVEICNSFKDIRLKIFSEKDDGIYHAMNKGIGEAKGSWLYFMGSDDRLYNDKVLEKVLLVAQETRLKIIYGNVFVCGDCGWANDGRVYDGYFKKTKIISKNICHQSIFYRKAVFDILPWYNLNYKICADHDLNIRAVRMFDFLYFDIIIAKFNGGGMSSVPDSIFIKDYDKILIKNHLKILHLLKTNNRVLLNEAIGMYQERRYFFFLRLLLILSYKLTIQKLILKTKSYL